MPAPPRDEFLSEPITPATASATLSSMSRGQPGLPQHFTWRGQHYHILEVLRAWKTTGRDRGETYLRRHWYTIRTDPPQLMTIYFERQARPGTSPASRWWIYSRQLPAEG